jgi:hypothetical protein
VFFQRKYKPSNVPYCLLRLQEIVVAVAIANIMAPCAVPKQKSKQKHSLGIVINLV